MSLAQRYARHVALDGIGADGQARIEAASVLVVGLGGLGCPAAEYLAACGVGRLLLNDFDRVDETNLARQILYTPADVGALKVDAARRRLETLNPGIVVEPIAERLDEEGLADAVARAHIVLDGTDNFTTRFAVNAACVRHDVPLVSGAALRFEGQIVVFSSPREGPCYRCLYSDEDEWLGDCQGQGVLATVPGVIGTMMAGEAIKLIVGDTAARHNRLSLWDARTGEWSVVTIKPDPQCPVCGGGSRQTAPG